MASVGQFRNAILCEDVREEIGNKKSIMGVFGGDVLVQSLPARIRVAFYAEYLPNDDEVEEMDFLLKLGDTTVAEGKLSLPPNKKDVVTFIIQQGFLQLTEPTEIVLLIGSKNEMVETLRKDVKLAIPAHANASPPPS